MVEIASNTSFITTAVGWITDIILWVINIFTGGITSIGSISIVLLILLLVTIWAYRNQENIAQYL